MSFFIKISFIGVLLFSFIFASWYVLHGDIIFSSDIARDFNLLRQVDEKKLVLIGPRSSGGLYHGPLWLYVNYPAYAISGGNPIAVGWNWVVLWALFTIICFFVARKLFDLPTAYFFTSWASVYCAFHVRGMDNPHGALVVMPLLIYFFVRYLQSLHIKHLIFFFIVLGTVTQFEIAIGIPFILLSIPALVYITVKHKKPKHLFTYGIMLLMLSNFFFFDLRHQFLIFHNALQFASPTVNHQLFNYSKFFQERMILLFSNIEFLRVNVGIGNVVLFVLLLVGVYLQRKEKKISLVAFSVLYFYIGFFALSFIDKGPILYWYLYPMYPLFFLIASSFITTRYKLVFISLFSIIMILNIRTALQDMSTANSYFGTNVTSWKFLDSVAKKVFSSKEQTFGYFVYAPDAFAYAEKYAMYYESRHSTKRAGYFIKQPITYVVAEPPPPNNPNMKSTYWIQHQVNITATPSATITFPNGYQILKFNLTEAETKVTFDPSVDPGINFR